MNTDGLPFPTREIDGQTCTNRNGIATLAGIPPGNTINVRAANDPDFPEPLTKTGHTYWYPLDGARGVHTYLARLADRAHAKKPPPVEPGDPDELLDSRGAAHAMHITWATFRSYVRHSIPHWEGHKPGRPLVPPPDAVLEVIDRNGVPHQQRHWYRATLTHHQQQRPGPGTGAGRPKGRRGTDE